MSITASVTTSIAEECCLETGNTTVDNNKHLSIEKSTDNNKIREKGYSAYDNCLNKQSNHGGKNDKSFVSTIHGNKLSCDNNKLIATLTKKNTSWSSHKQYF